MSQSPLDQIYKSGDDLFELRCGFSHRSEHEAGTRSVREEGVCGFQGKTGEVKAASLK